MAKDDSPSELIDARIEELGLWSHDGIVCTGEAHKDKVKMTLSSPTRQGELRWPS